MLMEDSLLEGNIQRAVVDLLDPVDFQDGASETREPVGVFPKQDVDLYNNTVHHGLQTWPKMFKRLYSRAMHIWSSFSDTFYSFRDNLRTGNYASYPHERIEEQIAGNNCTTIIPEVYLTAEAFGLKPQIVQFVNFMDVKTKKDKEEVRAPAHFAIVLDAGRKSKYLLDPFWNIFGPIREQTDSYWKIGRRGGRTARKREFEHVVYYSAQEFASMMQRLKDPAESLDMLVAGQKVFDPRIIQKFDCKLMVYYDRTLNIVSTRLYVPSKSISDKAIYCRMKMSDAGEVEQTSIDLFLAKNYGWTFLVEPKKVASTDFATLRRIRRIVQRMKSPATNKKICIERNDRIAQTLKDSCLSTNDQKALAEIVDSLYRFLSPDSQQAIHKMVLARTLYEFKKPMKEYLYTEKQHDARIRKLRAEEIRLREHTKPYDAMMWFHDWKLQKLESSEARKARRVKRKRDERQSDLVEEINFLNNLRHNNKRVYRRIMDKVLFAKTLDGLSTEELDSRVKKRGLDSRVGYLAMVADFIPFVLEARDDLELKLYMGPIKEKIAARQARKNARVHHETSSTALEFVEAAAQ